MTDSAIERLKNRQRKKVTTRNASLNQDNHKNINTSSKSNSSDSIPQVSQSLSESNSNDSISQVSQSLSGSNSNDSIPQVSQSLSGSNSSDSISQVSLSTDNEPVRRTIRLDPKVDEYMDTLCKANKVTKETLFEAAILVCSNNQKTLKKVIANAQDRYSNRKRIGEMKKLQTMNRKFQSRF